MGTFLLPGGRPRLFGALSCLAAAIHAGGRPRRFPPPAAIRSILKIASVSCACSTRRAVRMFAMSIGAGYQLLRAVGSNFERSRGRSKSLFNCLFQNGAHYSPTRLDDLSLLVHDLVDAETEAAKKRVTSRPTDNAEVIPKSASLSKSRNHTIWSNELSRP